MPSYVAFLRAVNVGGRWLKMDALRAHLTELGYGQVETYIQSGNVLLTSPLRSTEKVAVTLEGQLARYAGFDVPCMVRTPRELSARAAEVRALPSLLAAPGRRYVAFGRHEVPAEGADAVEAWDSPDEQARVLGRDVLFELGVGFHEAKLTAARLEKLTRTTLTARDLKVVDALAERWGEP